MVWLKACPKCKGDLFLDQDHYGKYQSCMQCGYMRDLLAQTAAAAQALATRSTGTDGAGAGQITAVSSQSEGLQS